jgi:nitrate reductase gamma subunit
MASLPHSLNHLLFALLPYVAVVAFLVVIAIRRFGVTSGVSSESSPPAAGSRTYGERLLFGYGVLVIVVGHVLALLFPEQVLLWNNDALRRYVLEVGVLIVALMTLAGLMLTAARCLVSAAARQRIGPADWLLYALLLVQFVSGVVMAVLYPWGSSGHAVSVVPYLRSLARIEPDLATVSDLPDPVKLHLVTAWLVVLVLPLTRVVRPLVAGDSEPGRARAPSRLATTVLLVGLGLSLLALAPRLGGAHPPGNQQGYEPEQPIAFSHRLHAGELQVSCLYCHADAEKGRHAGIASAGVCMNCHRFVTAAARDLRAEAELAKEERRPPRTLISPELAKLYAALGVGDKPQAEPTGPGTPIRWVKVHNLPAFTRFDHGAHVNAGVDCQRCHGPVETMERVRQVEDLSMGWCVQCHRDADQNGVAGREVHPSNDCTTCHH